jgi:hypothetical protein
MCCVFGVLGVVKNQQQFLDSCVSNSSVFYLIVLSELIKFFLQDSFRTPSLRSAIMLLVLSIRGGAALCGTRVAWHGPGRVRRKLLALVPFAEGYKVPLKAG